MLRIDHVVFAVRDLEAAAARLWREHGLAAVPGGRHPAWGTGNAIVPLGEDYVELLAAVDEERARASDLGRAILERAEAGDRPFAVCLRTDDLDAVAGRLGLAIVEGMRTRPDGTELRWRSAGLDRTVHDPSLPFFIEWQVPPGLHPGAARARHLVRPAGIAWAVLGGDEGVLREWLGGASLPLRAVPGPPGLAAVGIATDRGEIVLR
ncbi:MAG TPA: VOC family protein [Actinomycetota bacterium]|nr:VOC family protein [Actinomycetota bacterium]